MPKTFLLTTVFLCAVMVDSAVAETVQSGQVAFVPSQAIKCTSNSQTSYVPMSFLTLTLDVNEPLKLSIYEQCEMRGYCLRFCEAFGQQLRSNSAVTAPKRLIHKEQYSKVSDACYLRSLEITEVDFVGQILRAVKVLREQQVDMQYCHR